MPGAARHFPPQTEMSRSGHRAQEPAQSMRAVLFNNNLKIYLTSNKGKLSSFRVLSGVLCTKVCGL